jgi:hypothetical protein
MVLFLLEVHGASIIVKLLSTVKGRWNLTAARTAFGPFWQPMGDLSISGIDGRTKKGYYGKLERFPLI